MTTKEILIGALQYYSIEVIKIEADKVTIGRNYEVEVEANELYKLISDGQVVAPFDDVDELCRFVLL
ncbi:MAG: hypothetical protein KGZ74_17630 [Chitinophagaceae bacterium]|jgi:hypothetical protein|nr:hypothetical protein [Chitinophagaceae bacterium]